MIHGYLLALGVEYLYSLGQEQVGYVYSLVYGTTHIVADVQDKAFCSLRHELQKGMAHLAGTTGCKAVQIDVADTIVYNTIIRYGWQLDGAACNACRARFFLAWSLEA